MSTTRITYVFCDFETDPAAAFTAPRPNNDAREQRRLLRLDGWDRPRIDGVLYDRCDTCKAEGRAEPQEGT